LNLAFAYFYILIVNNQQPGSFKKTLGISACLLILIHFLICVSVIVLPSKLVRSNLITSTYRSLMVVGPFFYESQIKSFSFLSTSLYSNGEWSRVGEDRLKNFQKYQRAPWRYDLLRKNDFEEYCAYQIASSKNKNFETIKRSKAFRELNQFIIDEYANGHADSVSMAYVTKIYLRENSAFRFDTAFIYTYDPNEIAPAKH